MRPFNHSLIHASVFHFFHQFRGRELYDKLRAHGTDGKIFFFSDTPTHGLPTGGLDISLTGQLVD